MTLDRLLAERTEHGSPVRVGLIGAGKFGSMFLTQIPTTVGLDVAVIVDLDVDRAKKACADVGWSAELVGATRFTDDMSVLMDDESVEVVVEATGNPIVGVTHARQAFAAGKHVVMVNVEADVLVGPVLAAEARSAGVVYTMAYGDQPALTCELVGWARACGFDVVAAGKGTKYLPSYHRSTPDTVWDHYGLTPEEAQAAGMTSQMFNSFLDGTKSAIEMCAISNATDLTPAPDGLGFPPCGADDLSHVLRPADVGGVLHHKGQVEVISSLERDGRPVHRDLRWGVYVVLEAPNDYAASCFSQYGLVTDDTGRYSSMYKPFHLIGLELNMSVLSAALRQEAIGCADGWRGDVVATAKQDLKAGQVLDGEGGFSVYGTLLPAARSVELGGLALGLTSGVRLARAVPEGHFVTWADVEFVPDSEALDLRRGLEARGATVG